MHKTSCLYVMGILLLVFTFQGVAQTVPELMYYKFSETGGTATQNFATPGVGTNPVSFVGLTMGSAGQFGSALMGTNVVSNY